MPKRSNDRSEQSSVFEQTLMREIGARLRARRIALGRSQVQIRARVASLGVPITRTQYSRIEQGQSMANAAEVIVLAQVLEVSDRWLLRGET